VSRALQFITGREEDIREKGDKLLQVANINHLLKGDIFPSVSRVHSDPEEVTTNLQRGLHPPPPYHRALVPLNPRQASKDSAT